MLVPRRISAAQVVLLALGGTRVSCMRADALAWRRSASTWPKKPRRYVKPITETMDIDDAIRREPRFTRLDDSHVIPITERRLIGYARVSMDEQTTALQLDALRAAGCTAIHEDSASGASRSRPGLSSAIEDLRAGDTLVVWRFDHLGRSLRDLLDISEMLRDRDVALRSLTDHIDTNRRRSNAVRRARRRRAI